MGIAKSHRTSKFQLAHGIEAATFPERMATNAPSSGGVPAWLRRLPFRAGILVAALGLLVIIAWLMQWRTLIQVLPGLPPMKFDTAVCFICGGIALALLAAKREKLVTPLSAVPVAIGLTILFEYFTGKNFGIDELFVGDYVFTATSYPGRMSPLAASSFLLLGCSLILAAWQPRRRRALTAAALFACATSVVAIVALFGYATGIEAAYGWGAYTRMAVHTASAFLLASTSILVWVSQNQPRTESNFLRWLPITASLTLMLMIAFVASVSFAQLKDSVDWRKHSYQVLVESQSLVNDVFSTQRGMRNFAITAQDAALDLYDTGVRNIPKRTAALLALTRDNPAQQDRLHTLVTDINNQLEYSRELIATRKTQGLEAAIKMESTGRGFALINQVQGALQTFTGEEERLLDERSKAAEVDFHNTERLLVFGSVMAAMLLIFANWMTNREIKRRRRAERMQEMLATEIKGLLESSGEGIYGIDVNGCCTFINAAGIRLIGYETYEVLGKNIHDLIHHSRRDGSSYPRDESPIYRAFKSDLSCRVDSEVFWRKDGSSFLVEYTAFPIVEESAIKGAVVTFSDISERKQHEAEREKLIQELQQALAEVRTLSGMIPICGWCKKVRSDTGFWQNVELYIHSRTDAKFSHGICPACADKMKTEIGRANALDPGL